MTQWTDNAVHEALVRWGAISARVEDGGRGYPGQVAWASERIKAPYRALEPAEFSSDEFVALEAAIHALSQPHKVAVLCYYKPGHLRRRHGSLGTDGKGRERCPSLRVLAGYLLVSKDTVAARLISARMDIARRLTPAVVSDSMEGKCIT